MFKHILNDKLCMVYKDIADNFSLCSRFVMVEALVL